MECKGRMNAEKKLREVQEATLGEEKIGEFLEALSSKAPVPSGGGVTALSASCLFSCPNGGQSYPREEKVCGL